MKKTFIVLSFALLALSLHAQTGIRAGMNIASQSLHSNIFNYNNKQSAGFQAGLVYQHMPKQTGFGLESGLLFSRKGGRFEYYDTDALYKGSNELDYLEIPLNLRYRLTVGPVGLYAYAGLYGAYLLQAKSTTEGDIEEPKLELNKFADRADYGYTVGTGVELLRKVQLGINWNGGLKDIASVYGQTPLHIASGKNKVFSVNVVLLF